MFHERPPFNTPYKTFETHADGLRVTEFLPDGTTRIVPASEALEPARQPQQRRSQPVAGKGVGPTAASTRMLPTPVRPLAFGNDRAVMYLEVSFAEKDEAKRLGAKWDKDLRKWYAPHGVDINLFRRWWPDDLKKEMLAFGQLPT